jgi:hypothetical protein
MKVSAVELARFFNIQFSGRTRRIPTRGATFCDWDADGTSMLSSGKLRHEMMLCVLLNSRPSQAYTNALEQSRRRLEDTKRLTQSTYQRGFQRHPSSSGCLSIPLGITPNTPLRFARSVSDQMGGVGRVCDPMARCEP